MLPACISYPDCLKHTMGEQSPESPDRIGAVSDMLLIKGLLDFMQPCEAPPATEQQLAQANSSLYIHTLTTLSPLAGSVQVDPDTSMNPHSLQAALRAAGAAVRATAPVLTKAPDRLLQCAPARAPRRLWRCRWSLLFQ